MTSRSLAGCLAAALGLALLPATTSVAATGRATGTDAELAALAADLEAADASEDVEAADADPDAGTETADGGFSLAVADDPADRVVVIWDAEVADATRVAALDHLGVRGTPIGTMDTVTVGAAGVAAVVAELDARPDVAAVQQDREIGLTRAPRPNDPFFAEQWGLENTGHVEFNGGRSTSGVDVRARDAWAISEGTPQVTVAVIDSGIDVTHPDLVGAIWTNPGEVADGLDTDGNGFVDDVNGWDFVRERPIALHGADQSVGETHGTQVAGVIAARSRNATGIAGMAPQVSLMPIRAFQEQPGEQGAGRSTVSMIVASLLYAAANGADVINASWESPRADPALERAVVDVRVPVVAASGNGRGGLGLDLSNGSIAVPASYTLPNLVAVTAIDPRGDKPAFANFGARTVDLGAPGVGIVTTRPGGAYASFLEGTANGTSFAAPFVSGALALGLSAEPLTEQADLIDTLLRTTTPRSALAGRTTTGGSLDAGAFLAALERPVCAPGAVPVAGFTDVPPASTHARAIDCIAAAGVTQGVDGQRFAPQRTVSRGQLASFLAAVVRAAGAEPDDVPDAFVDDDGSVHEPGIDLLAALGILQGDAQGRVQPDVPVTRAQLAAMLTRTYAVLDDGVTPRPSRRWFVDTGDNVHRDAIDVARDLGLVRGTSRVEFDTRSGTRRDQMASTLARLLDQLARDGIELAGLDLDT